MNILEEYKELYNKELEHKDELNGKMGVHITFITVISTAEILLCKDIFLIEMTSWFLIYVLLTFISMICFAITLFYFYKSYTGYDYHYVSLEKSKQYIDKAKNYAKAKGISKEYTEDYIESMFERTYCNFGILNSKCNMRKNNFQFKFTKWLCISFIALVIAYGFWIVKVNPYKSEMDSTSINKIYVEGGHINMGDEENKFPDDLQPDPEANVFHETFSRDIDIIHSENQSNDTSNKGNGSESK